MTAHYDTIGIDYANLRRPDRRIAARIHAALGPAPTVLNVGAGAGSYEPPDRQVTALEPSIEMIRQRPHGAAPVVQGVAEELPFDDDAFDAAMAVLTVHHWTDKARGLAELRRVSRGAVVILTFDPHFRGFWLTDYLPELIALDDGQMPTLAQLGQWLGEVDVHVVEVPHDCTDGFLGAYWRRPQAYLDPRIRAAISSFWAIDTSEGLARLERDLSRGAWNARYGHLMGQGTADMGYRLVVAR